jgi:trehalose 6-phosphate synthase
MVHRAAADVYCGLGNLETDGGAMLDDGEQNGSAAWTAQRLQAWFNRYCSGQSVIVLANRQPFRHERTADGGVVVNRSAGGLVTALEPLIEASSGVWVAHGAGTGDADVVDRHDGLDVPPSSPRYRLRRVWLSAREEQGYYKGFANEGLWPLCHRAHVRPIFRSADYKTYFSVNGRFAAAVCEEADSDAPLVLVQDYHFALAPAFIRDRLPRSTIIAFWHIPWPTARDFEICPWGRRLLAGLLGSNVVGFQTPPDCQNFLDSVEGSLEGARVDREHSVITYRGRRTTVRAYPVSIEWPSRWARQSPSVATCRQEIRDQLEAGAGMQMAVGVDRLDYTKGIEEKFLAVERLLESRRELRGRFMLAQIAAPTRVDLQPYRELRSRLIETAERINRRFAEGTYRPIAFIEAHHDAAQVYRFLRGADLCLVGSLHDGMNLVAKEFVAARDDERGVLVLSRFAGAARQLTGALIVNPYAIDEVADALAQALAMTDEEQAARMRRMRAVVAESSTYWWAGQMLQDVTRTRERLRQPLAS